jgi:hypothetical protein
MYSKKHLDEFQKTLENINSSNMREKIFNQKELSRTDMSEKMFRTVKSGLDKTSQGLLSVILIGNKIIDTSKKALSKDDSSKIKISIEDETKKNLVSPKKCKKEIESSDLIHEKTNSINCTKKSSMSNEPESTLEDNCHNHHHHHHHHDHSHHHHEHDHCSKHTDRIDLNQSESCLEDCGDEDECETGNIGYCRSHDLNFTGMLIHLLGDVISSLCVVISSIVVVNFGWVYFDTVCSIVICIAIIISTIPLNYMIFKKMSNAFSVTTKEQKYILSKLNEVIHINL